MLAQQDVEADAYDDHALHRTEHLRALLSGGEKEEGVRTRILRHLASHQKLQGGNV